ncbi:hypothetical protein [Roseinatronobacter monicus]|uniref:Uncharacterized protein n=1 Tax=Roseinatronobacter monicus TaxID=393481 RepID=A0A543K5P4_9RHOB|nr:hypothetical protein [Roseinatronobacter monicus]TQM90382.1 hypothetical protein BD293_3760 [Roseinatronobacter monicus]
MPTWTDALALADGTLLLAGNTKMPERRDRFADMPPPPVTDRPLTPAEQAAYQQVLQSYFLTQNAERATRFPMETLGFIARRDAQGWDLARTVQKGAIFGLAQDPDGAIWAVEDGGHKCTTGTPS